MSQRKSDPIPNKLVYNGHTYHRAETVEGVMWETFGKMVERLSKVTNSEDLSTTEKWNRSQPLWDEIFHYAKEINLRR